MADEIRIDYPDVLAAARKIVAGAGRSTERSKGWWRSYELPGLVASRLGVLEQRGQANTPRTYAAVTRFDRQVMRAFNEMAAEGTLVKIGRGERTPAGQVLGNEAEFYTPTAHAQAVGDRARALAERARVREMWESIYDRLSDAGYPPQSQRGDGISLSAGTWLELLGRLD
jgi:hypothetical protein